MSIYASIPGIGGEDDPPPAPPSHTQTRTGAHSPANRPARTYQKRRPVNPQTDPPADGPERCVIPAVPARPTTEEPMPEQLITPARAKEIRREAARHAAQILQIAVSNWDGRQHVRNDAEADLLNEEIITIYRGLYAQAIVGTNQRCSFCGIPYRIKADGTVGWHHGMTSAGFSDGEICEGVGSPPRST